MPVKSVGRRFQDCLLFLGALTTAGVATAGGCLLHGVAWRAEKLLVALLVVSFVFPVLFLSVNLILRKKYFEKLKKMKLKDGQEYLYSHREFARQKSEELLKQLRRIRFRSDWYAVCLGMSGACTAFCGGALAGNGAAVLIGIYAAYCCTFGFSRIRFSIKTLLSDFGKKYISFLHYPTVYALARKAAAALGCRGKIKIFLNPGVNAGVADMDGVISLDLGAILLDMLSDEELYAVLLHEFAHLKGESDAAAAERRFYVWLCEDRNENALYALTPYMFAFLDALYLLNYELYAYTVSILKENEADSAIARYGNAEKGASGLGFNIVSMCIGIISLITSLSCIKEAVTILLGDAAFGSYSNEASIISQAVVLMITSIITLVFAVIGLKNKQNSGRGMGVSGIICSIFALLISGSALVIAALVYAELLI